MKWSDIADVIGKAAPLIGSVVGGPAGAGVGAMIASALGVENSPEAVQAALGNPDALLKIKTLESEERKHFLQIKLAELQAELGDTQSARAAHADSIMPAIVTLGLTTICGAMLYALLFVEIPEQNRDILVQSLGTVFGFWGASIAYWVGTTRSSQLKTDILRGKQ